MSEQTATAEREADPKGEEFYSFPAKVPEGDWAYIIDDFGIAYRRGWWPFRSADTEEERRAVASWERKGHGEWKLGDGCGWASVRIAPNVDGCDAGQNYVGVWPDIHEAWKASADLHLYVRPQGRGGAVVFNCTLIIDLRDMTGTITTWPIDGSPIAADGFSEDFPEALKAQAGEKKEKILALLAEHIARRDAGKRKIETAYEKRHGG